MKTPKIVVLFLFLMTFYFSNFVLAQELKQEKKISEIISKLDDEDYVNREDATSELIKMVLKEEKFLKEIVEAHSKEKNPEVKARLNFVIESYYKNKKLQRPKVLKKTPKELKGTPPTSRGPTPTDIFKDFDYKKIFGGVDSEKAKDLGLESLGISKGMQDILKKMLSGEAIDPQELLKKILEKELSPLDNLKKQKKSKPNPKKVFGIKWERTEYGLKIVDVLEKSYADSIGLKKGDVITMFENKKIQSPEPLLSLKKKEGFLTISRKDMKIFVKCPVWK